MDKIGDKARVFKWFILMYKKRVQGQDHFPGSVGKP